MRPAWISLILLAFGCDDPTGSTADVAPPDLGVVDAAPPTEAPLPLVPAPAATARLTRAQYHHIIADVFGPDVVVSGPLEPDVALDGLWAIGAASTTISPRGVELYEAAAFTIAEQVVANEALRQRAFGCAGLDATCRRDGLAHLGRLLWRRPLTEEELAAVQAVAEDAATTLADPGAGLVFGVATLLQSPWFLFRPATGEGRLDAFADATRLAFFLWDSTPDAPLLAAAEAGDLDRPQSRRAWIEAMLDDPRARRGVRTFFNDYLHLRDLDRLIKDPTVFTRYSAELGPMAQEETLATLEHLVFEVEGDFRTLFTDRTTFLNRKLAALYGVPAPVAEGFGRTELPADGPRAGLLGHASILAKNAHPVSSSATLRGRFIRETLLCGAIPAPPADVDTALPEPNPELPTLRDRVGVHLTEPQCAGCHQIMDPIGLGLETFDGIGRFRATENEVAIDASGVLDGVPFDDARSLGEAIAGHPNLGPCLTRKLYSYAVGHVPTAGEAGEIQRLSAIFAEEGHRVTALMRAIAMSEGFRRFAPVEE